MTNALEWGIRGRKIASRGADIRAPLEAAAPAEEAKLFQNMTLGGARRLVLRRAQAFLAAVVATVELFRCFNINETAREEKNRSILLRVLNSKYGRKSVGRPRLIFLSFRSTPLFTFPFSVNEEINKEEDWKQTETGKTMLNLRSRLLWDAPENGMRRRGDDEESAMR
ncbi:hypothetical protein ACLOJK_014013 [Asimina triloba]